MAALTASLAALTAAQTLNEFVSQRRAATGLEREAAYQGSLLEQNATIAEQQAADAIARGAQDVYRHRAGVRHLIGEQRATLGASGVDIGSGSALDVQLDAARLGELDELTIRNNAAREAYGFKVEAYNYRGQATMTRMAARNQAAGLRNQSWGTLLNGTTSIAGMYSTNSVRPRITSSATPNISMTPDLSPAGWSRKLPLVRR
jgi:hypothetical protein